MDDKLQRYIQKVNSPLFKVLNGGNEKELAELERFEKDFIDTYSLTKIPQVKDWESFEIFRMFEEIHESFGHSKKLLGPSENSD
jgi:hypothetical protein